MLKYSLFVLFILLNTCVFAQDEDSVFAIRKGTSWAIKYTLKQGESLRMLSTRYYLSNDILENFNDAENVKKLAAGSSLNIPVIKQNYFTVKPSINSSSIHELYYRVAPKDDIGVISTYAGVSKSDMRAWNNLHGNTLNVGQVLFIGWVKVMVRDSTNPVSEMAFPQVHKKIASDAPKEKVPGGLDSVYDRQTNNGLNVLNEKGTAVFFERGGKPTVYYAFHNSTPRNTVIKVFNPGTSKTIYVKVLGPLPDTKQYANSIIGISNAAKEALGVTENKAWCELSYPAN